MTLYLLKYNNYYNRILKKEDSLDKYLEKNEAGSPKYQLGPALNNINFNPNDGVLTSHVVNWQYDMPDYLIVANGNDIVSRWFVIEAKRERKDQYSLSLRRDLLVDFYTNIYSSTCFIERSILPTNNDLIFNKEENLKFNQIKQKEVLLKDKTDSSWLVGYVALKSQESDTENDPYSRDTNIGAIRGDHISYVDISQEDFNTLSNNSGDSYSISRYKYNLKLDGYAKYYHKADGEYKKQLVTNVSTEVYNDGGTYNNYINSTYLAPDGNPDDPLPITSNMWFYGWDNEDPVVYIEPSQVGNTFANKVMPSLTSSAITEIKNSITSKGDKYLDYNTITQLYNNYNNKIIKHNGSFYRVSIVKGLGVGQVKIPAAETRNYLTTLLTNAETNYEWFKYGIYWDNFTNTDPTSYFSIDYFPSLNRITLTEVQLDKAFKLNTINLNRSIRLLDAPYKVFAIPMDYAKFKITDTVSGSVKTVYRELPDFYKKNIIALILKLCETYGSNIYDVQLLPYCPVPDQMDSSGYVHLGENITDPNAIYYNTIYDEDNANEIISCMVWCNSANNSIKLDSYNYEYNVNSKSNISLKVSNEVDFIRLCSPNYNGCFEFSPAKNRGVSGYEANWTLKPYSPYIHVNPIFGGLYNKDFNDQRGLVCSGQFSIPLISSKWTEYQIQNSSYMNAFNRQILNMETTYDIERDRAKTTGALNALSTGIGAIGAATFASGNPFVGLGAGAVAGGMSLFGLEKDLQYSDALHNEAMSLAQDKFTYSLQNIKALPYTLSNIGAFDVNSKIFPFLEYYSCTTVEKEALEKKLLMTGMTTMCIGKLSDYINYISVLIKTTQIDDDTIRYYYKDSSYIQAQLITCETILDDYHVLCEIASELHKGFRIHKEYNYEIYQPYDEPK